MLKIYQQTILTPVSFSGVGLHTGKSSTLTILPGKEDEGIVFKRVDIKDNNKIKANFKNVSSAKLCTTLENKFGIKVSTVEHLLAALYIAEIDNAVIEINNEEVPIMDGSSKVFLDELRKIKKKELNKKRKYLKILQKVELLEGEKVISIDTMDNSFEVDCQLNYENKIIGNQRNVVNFLKDHLVEIYQSRTFCLFNDIEKIKKAGLAKGGSLDNAVVVNDNEVLNEGGLRNDKEFVNHKILDLAGDFLLSGHRVLGKVFSYQGGHELTNTFLRKLFNSKTAFEITELKETIIPKKTASNQSIKLAVNA